MLLLCKGSSLLDYLKAPLFHPPKPLPASQPLHRVVLLQDPVSVKMKAVHHLRRHMSCEVPDFGMLCECCHSLLLFCEGLGLLGLLQLLAGLGSLLDRLLGLPHGPLLLQHAVRDHPRCLLFGPLHFL